MITDEAFITLESKCFLQIGPLLHLGPNVITDGTFILFGSSYYTCAFCCIHGKDLRTRCWRIRSRTSEGGQ